MKAQEMFETDACSRCDGTGHYAFNLMDGTRCYGCGGRGWKFTKRGQAAYDAWVAAWTKTIPAEEVTPGMKIVTKSVSGRRVVLTVTESKPDTLNVGQNRWDFRFAPGGALGGLGTFVGSPVELPATSEEKIAAYASVSAMPGARQS